MHWYEEKINTTTGKNFCKKQSDFLLPFGLLALFFLFPGSGFARKQLSEDAGMAVLTCGPGKPLYSIFGHTALQVTDPVNGIDEVYNFGTFDFNAPHFYLKFLTGKLNYKLSRTSYQGFVDEYKAENRWICRQEVMLPGVVLQKIYDSLQVVNQPGHRYYRYNFFTNNCSTKIFDLLLAFGGNPQMIDSLHRQSGYTFRSALKTYIGGRQWLSPGINLLLGPFADQKISRLQSTYLPDFLMSEAENTRLAGFPEIITNGSYTAPEPADPDVPMIVFWVLLIGLVVEALWMNTSQGVTDAIDMILFGLSGLLGFLLVFLWAWSAHVSLHVNLNLIWAFPPNLFLVLSIRRHWRKFNRIYLFLYALMLFFLLINWHRLPQTFPLVLMPVVTLLVFRAVNRVFRFREKDATLEISADEVR